MADNLVKVLLVHNFYQQRGGEYYVFQAEKHLLESHGHQVVVYTRDNEEIKHYDLRHKLRLIPQTIYSTESRQQITRIIQQEAPDIAHVHNTFPLISPAVYEVFQQHRIPVVQTLHNYRWMCAAATLHRDDQLCTACLGKAFPYPAVLHGCYHGSRAQSAIVAAMIAAHRKTWQQIDTFIAPTQFVKDLYTRIGIPANRIMVKPHFLAGKSAARAVTEIGEDFMFVGRLSPEKGLGTLLAAWERIDAPLKIIGDGPLRHELQAQVKRNGLSDRIEFLGELPHETVLQRLRQASALIVPSVWYEVFGLVVMEAFSLAIPVIASHIGSLISLVAEKDAGWTFPPGDSGALAACVQQVIVHPEEITLKGEAARRFFEREMTPESNYQQLHAIYQQTLQHDQRHTTGS